VRTFRSAISGEPKGSHYPLYLKHFYSPQPKT
jgi:hypothetical protein